MPKIDPPEKLTALQIEKIADEISSYSKSFRAVSEQMAAAKIKTIPVKNLKTVLRGVKYIQRGATKAMQGYFEMLHPSTIATPSDHERAHDKAVGQAKQSNAKAKKRGEQ